MLTLQEIQVLMPLIDQGVKVAGLSLFSDGRGAILQSALGKLQAMAEEQVAQQERLPSEEVPDQPAAKKPNGKGRRGPRKGTPASLAG